MIRYHAPFNKPSLRISESDVENILAAAQRPTTASLDGQELRKREHSDKLGFVKLTATIDRHSDYSLADVVSALSYSNLMGIRGSRAVMVDDEPDTDEDDNEVYTAWVGRNVWYNEHRLTAGWPGTDDEHDQFARDVEARFGDEVAIQIEDLTTDEDDEPAYDGSDDEDDAEEEGGALMTAGATIEINPDQLRTLATAMKMIGETVLEILDAQEAASGGKGAKPAKPAPVDMDNSDIKFAEFGGRF